MRRICQNTITWDDLYAGHDCDDRIQSDEKLHTTLKRMQLYSFLQLYMYIYLGELGYFGLAAA